MKPLFLFLLVVIMACKQEPPITGNCDLNLYDGFSFSGSVGICNASGSQLDFPAFATFEVKDSLFIINIVDEDPLINYHIIDTAVVACVYREGNENYDLYEFPTPNPIRIGVLTTNGTSLHWDIRRDPCPESTAFFGFKN